MIIPKKIPDVAGRVVVVLVKDSKVWKITHLKEFFIENCVWCTSMLVSDLWLFSECAAGRISLFHKNKRVIEKYSRRLSETQRRRNNNKSVYK